MRTETASNWFDSGMKTDSREILQASFDFQRWPERDDGFKAKQVGDSSTVRGLRGSPRETKQSTSCSVEPGRSFLAAVLFGQASAEQGHGEGCQRQRNPCEHAGTHAYSHIHVHRQSLSLHNDSLSLVAAILEAIEGTS